MQFSKYYVLRYLPLTFVRAEVLKVLPKGYALLIELFLMNSQN